MTENQLYECTACGSRKRLPEAAVSGPQSVRTGCDACGRLGQHLAVGRPEWAALKEVTQ